MPAIEEVLSRLKFIRSKRQEYLISLSLDSSGNVIRRRTVTIGLLDMAVAHPREVFAGPLKDRAAAIIVAHNHPSGDPNPSNEDIKSTQQLVAAGILLGIPVRDHIIITTSSHFCFSEECLIT
jgi:DNA repair protein RadC